MTDAAEILALDAAVRPLRSPSENWLRERWPNETTQFVVSFDIPHSSYNFTTLLAFENDIYDQLGVKSSIEGIRDGCLEVLVQTEGRSVAEMLHGMAVKGELDWMAVKYRINFLQFHKTVSPERVLYED